MRAVPLIAATIIAGVVAILAWVWFDRPVPVDVSWNGPLASVSFAPFRRGQNPLTENFPNEQQIGEDLQRLAGKVGGVRTYSTQQNLNLVPKLAKPLGIKVTLGAWLTSSKDPANLTKNDKEINDLIAVANAYPDTVTRVLIGNEVLLRNDLSPDELIAYIRKVKQAIKQPVSYADVWVFFLKYPQVARELDFLTIHILPFWEDEPVAIEHEEPYLINVVNRIRAAFPGKPILIGEAGWPSTGRDRGEAVVSLVNEARFVRTLANVATKNGFDYNVVEAFDQPWKSTLENTVGAYWGVLDVDRVPKFAMSGPVTEVLDWKERAIIALVAAVLASLVFGRHVLGFGRNLAVAGFAQIVSWAAVSTAFHVAATSFYTWQDIWGIVRGGLPALLALGLTARAAAMLGPSAPSVPVELAKDSWRGEILAFWFAGYALVWSVLLAFDGRYRDIPEMDFSLPCVGISLLILVRAILAKQSGESVCSALGLSGLFAAPSLSGGTRRKVVKWLAILLILAAPMSLIGEGLAVIGDDFVTNHPTWADRIPLILKAMVWNREMDLWAAMQWLMAVPFFAEWRRGSRVSARSGSTGERVGPEPVVANGSAQGA